MADPSVHDAPIWAFTMLRSERSRWSDFRSMTAPWLQRLIDCHLARNAALGHEVPEMPYCPLVPKGVTATVRPTPTGFAVEIRSSDRDTAKEIVRRAEGLRSR
jgi:hypothetical protein